MTEQPRKSATLSPEEWKQLCLLGCVQLQNFLNAIPPTVEGGVVGLTAAHMADIESHLERMKSLHLYGWLRSKPLIPVPTRQPEAAQQVNGESLAEVAAAPLRQKRKYTRRAQPEVA